MNNAPLACNLSALDSELRAEHMALAGYLLHEAAAERIELEDGYAFRFAADLFDKLAAFVANERRCCPFLRFELIVEPESEPLTLRMTGRQGAKDVLRAELGL